MRAGCRLALFAIALAAAAYAAVLLSGIPASNRMWPLGSSPPTRAFVAAVAMAGAASFATIAITRDVYALRTAGLALVAGLAPMAVYLFAILEQESVRFATVYVAAGAAIVALCAAAAFWLTRSTAPEDARPTPRPARMLFGALAVILAFAGAGLLLRYPLMPWTMSRSMATATGFAFVGAMFYFLHAWLHPTWSNARAQLASLLAFALVLGFPFARMLVHFEDDGSLSLVAFSLTMAVCAAVAIAYLAVLRPWRLLGPRAESPAP
ncbi:MAG: hypothetical protein ABI585_10360 [Betaproteobacteria bacterium]